jgi:hypothetical protein
MDWSEQHSGSVIRFWEKSSAVSFLRSLSGNYSNMVVMRGFLGRFSFLTSPTDQETIEQLAWRLMSGRLRIAPAGIVPQPIPVFAEVATVEEEKTWIEVQLLGEDDQPVAGVAYEIALPDGSVEKGRTDSQGLARIEGIDPGTCQVTFSELDKDAWEPV